MGQGGRGGGGMCVMVKWVRKGGDVLFLNFFRPIATHSLASGQLNSFSRCWFGDEVAAAEVGTSYLQQQ